MADVIQLPSPLNLRGVSGSPFSVTLDITAVDENDDAVAWSIFSNAVGIISPANDALVPTVTSPETGQLLVTWTGDQTALMADGGPYSWALEVQVGTLGVYSLVAGSLVMVLPTQPGESVDGGTSLQVDIGTFVITLDIVLAGGAGGLQTVTTPDGTITATVSPDGTNVALEVTPGTFDADGAAAAAQAAAIAAAAADATTKANGAQTAAITAAEAFATSADNALRTATEAFAATVAADAQANAEAYTDTEVASERTRAETAEALLTPLADFLALVVAGMADLATVQFVQMLPLDYTNPLTDPALAFNAALAALPTMNITSTSGMVATVPIGRVVWPIVGDIVYGWGTPALTDGSNGYTFNDTLGWAVVDAQVRWGNRFIFCGTGSAATSTAQPGNAVFGSSVGANIHAGGGWENAVFDGSFSVAGAVGYDIGIGEGFELDFVCQNFGPCVAPTVTSLNTGGALGNAGASQIVGVVISVAASPYLSEPGTLGGPVSMFQDGMPSAEQQVQFASGVTTGSITVTAPNWWKTAPPWGFNVYVTAAGTSYANGGPFFFVGNIAAGASLTITTNVSLLPVSPRTAISFGCYVTKPSAWIEKTKLRGALLNNAVGLVIDGQNPSGPPTSFAFNDFDFWFLIPSGCDGVHFTNGASKYNGYFKMRGNMSQSNDGSKGFALKVSKNAVLKNEHLDIRMELDNHATGPYAATLINPIGTNPTTIQVDILNSSSMVDCDGRLAFLDFGSVGIGGVTVQWGAMTKTGGTWNPGSGANRSTINFSFGGPVSGDSQVITLAGGPAAGGNARGPFTCLLEKY